jgi:NADH-quinone oxidoreductase subunit N
LRHDIVAIIPELMLIGTALVLLFIDPFLPPDGRRGLSWLGIFSCATAAISIWFARGDEFTGFNHAVALDKFAVYFKILLLVVAIMAMLLSEKHLALKGRLLGDYYALILLTTVGMMIMAGSIDLITFFVGLELMALSTYLLAGFFRYEEHSIEASLKYFLTGSFASLFLLFGMAWLYGTTGATNFKEIGDAVRAGGVPTEALVVAVIMLVGGFGFKVAAAPFHNWAPDVYQGAPTPAAAFLSVGPKIATFAVVIRVFTIMLGGEGNTWVPLTIAMSVATMLIGATLAIVQRDLKRMLGYSSIAHVGYLLLALVAIGETSRDFGAGSILFYLAAYSFMNMGAFGVLVYISNSSDFHDRLDEMAGLGKCFPCAAAVMTVFMLSLAGIPPTAGFVAKFYLFASVVDAGYAWLAVIGVLFSLVSAFYYLRVIVYMYMREPETPLKKCGKASFSWDLNLGLGIAVAGVFTLGILPSPILQAAQDAVVKVMGF